MSNIRRLLIAVLALVVWLLITVWNFWGPREPTTLESVVTQGVIWRIVIAGLFLAVLTWLMGWRDLGLNLPRPMRSIKVLWFPALYLAAFVIGVIQLGLPAPSVIGFLAINTIAVGFSEELMFRGVLYRALANRFSLWPAVWVSSAAFGSVHVLNAFTTGNLSTAAAQAVTAFMSGVFFVALTVRTRSLLPAMVYHTCWNFLLLMLANRLTALDQASADPTGVWLGVPMLLVLPNFLYGLYVLRRSAAMAEPDLSAEGPPTRVLP